MHLQASIAPELPAELPGVEIAYRYLPSGTTPVGGDWFDVIPLAMNRVALVVGDVMGHGLESAAVMGHFRIALRTLANLDLPPDQVLYRLNELAEQLNDVYLATCIYLVYDPASRRCELSNAGHLPPILIHPDGTSELLELPTGVPIGVGGVRFETTRLDLADGSRLAVCTDGLVEAHHRDIDDGLNALCTRLGNIDETLDDACETIVRALTTEVRSDDVALLLVRFTGTEA